MSAETSMSLLAVRLIRDTAVLNEQLRDIAYRCGMLAIAMSVERPGADALAMWFEQAEAVLDALPAALETLVTTVIARPDLGPLAAPVSESDTEAS